MVAEARCSTRRPPSLNVLVALCTWRATGLVGLVGSKKHLGRSSRRPRLLMLEAMPKEVDLAHTDCLVVIHGNSSEIDECIMVIGPDMVCVTS